MKMDELDLAGTYTYEEYLKWTFWECLEIINRGIFKTSPTRRHQDISMKVSNRIFNCLKGKNWSTYTAPTDVRLSPLKRKIRPGKTYKVVQPDIFVVCDFEKLDDQGCTGAPDVIIEILSLGNSKKEMRNKFELYQENGVREYIIINPMKKNIFQYLLNEDGIFVEFHESVQGGILASLILPGFEMLVGEIFAD